MTMTASSRAGKYRSWRRFLSPAAVCAGEPAEPSGLAEPSGWAVLSGLAEPGGWAVLSGLAVAGAVFRCAGPAAGVVVSAAEGQEARAIVGSSARAAVAGRRGPAEAGGSG